MNVLNAHQEHFPMPPIANHVRFVKLVKLSRTEVWTLATIATKEQHKIRLGKLHASPVKRVCGQTTQKAIPCAGTNVPKAGMAQND